MESTTLERYNLRGGKDEIKSDACSGTVRGGQKRKYAGKRINKEGVDGDDDNDGDGDCDETMKPVKHMKPRGSKLCESDVEVLWRRQKQIDYGYNTPEYLSYLQQVPRDSRSSLHPSTPEKTLKYSRRSWDTLVKIWRKQLHIWDPKL